MARATTEFLVELAQSDKVWALGETGLDYYHSTEFVAQQKQCFARHIAASKIVKNQWWCILVLLSKIPLILFVQNIRHMVFCIVSLKIGKRQKQR